MYIQYIFTNPITAQHLTYFFRSNNETFAHKYFCSKEACNIYLATSPNYTPDHMDSVHLKHHRTFLLARYRKS